MKLTTSMSVSLMAVNYVLLGLAVLTVGLRYYTRITRKSLGMDDHFILAALVLFIITVAMSTASTANGLGAHAKDVVPSQVPDATKYFALWQFFYVTSTVPAKTSICFSLMRVSAQTVHRRILWALIAASTIVTIVAWVAVFTTCRPFPYTWDKTIRGGTCQSIDQIIVMSYVVSGINVVTDWTCAIMPVFVLWNLQMARNLKISVYVVLGMGSLASTATLIRLKTIESYRNEADYFYGVAEVVIWSAVEVGFGIIAASAATLKPLFRSILGSTGGSSSAEASRTRRHKESIRLDGTSKGDVTTVIYGGHDNHSAVSDEDTTSERRILRRMGGDITVTKGYNVRTESNMMV